MVSVCIISGRFPATKFASSINHKAYADRFDYTYIHCNWPTHFKNPYLNKPAYILNYMDLFDYIVWIDDDAFFIDFQKDIMDYKPTGDKILSICKSPDYKQLKTYLSSGQFILKCNDLSRLLLNKLINLPQKTVKEWWSENLGFYTNGDQDLLIYLLLNDPLFKDCFDLHNYKKFNSRIDNLTGTDSHKPLIIHFTGIPEVKERDYKKVQQKLNLQPSLVPNDIIHRYRIPEEKDINWFTFIFRSLRKWLNV